MNSICLSVAPNLRCQGLSNIENIILAIPSAVELIFSLTLAFTNSSIRGRKRWLLVCDGLSFFLLALADALAHLLPQVSNSNQVFTIFDFVLAGASFLPILAYTLFLVLFSRANLVTYVPTRFSHYIVVTLFVLIPLIIISNELGSLLGLSHTSFSLTNVTPVVGIKFLNLTFSRIASFFSFVSVTLLTLFQATNFVLAFFRVVRAMLDARKAEGTKSQTSQTSTPEEIHLFRGLGWVCAGLKLGAIETVVGFVDINFGVAVARRALRMFGRAALIIGVIKGMNIVEDFGRWKDLKELSSESSQGSIEKPVEPTRVVPNMISFPRNSTFRQMSPSATEFHTAQRLRKTKKRGPSPLVLGSESAFNRFKDIESLPTSIASRKRPGERVTIRYDGEAPPVLDVRFSAIGLDVPDLPKMPERALLTTVMEDPHEDRSSPFGAPPITGPRTAPAPTSRMSFYGLSKPASTLKTADSLEVLREISAQFPSLPPRVMPGQALLPDPRSRRDSDAEWREISRARSIQRRQQLQMAQMANSPTNPHERGATELSHSDSIRRKPVPGSTVPPSPAQSSPSIYAPEEEYEQPRKAPTPPLSNPTVFSPTSSEEDGFTRTSGEFTPGAAPSLTRTSTFDTVGPKTPPTALVLSQPLLQRKPKQMSRSSQIVSYLSPQSSSPHTETLPEKRQRRLSEMRQQLGIMPVPEEDKPYQMPYRNDPSMHGWLRKQGPLYELQAMGRGGEAEDDEAIIDEAYRRAGLTRIKSVNSVSVHTTPRAQQMFDVRSSLIAEEDDVDVPGLPSSMDLGRESLITASLRRPARSDSGVFSEDDRKWVRQTMYRRSRLPVG